MNYTAILKKKEKEVVIWAPVPLLVNSYSPVCFKILKSQLVQLISEKFI